MTTATIRFSESNALAALSGAHPVAEVEAAIRTEAAAVGEGNGYRKTEIVVADVVIRLDVYAPVLRDDKIIEAAIGRELAYLTNRMIEGGPFAKYVQPERLAALGAALRTLRAA